MNLELYQDTDFIAFVELLNALATELGGQATDEAAQLEYESWIKRDLSKQRVIIRNSEEPSQLVGYADFFVVEASAEANLALGVLEDWRGLEHDLLNWLVLQVQPLDVKALNMYAPGKAADLQRFLEAQGFKQTGAYRLLMLEPVTQPRDFTLPAGYTLTTFAATPDSSLFIEASNRSFADLWGHTPATERAWQNNLDHYEPQDLYLLLYGDAPAGLFKVRVTENVGYVDSPGLAPEHRSTELYGALALAGLHHINPYSLDRVLLETWGEPEETIRAYEALGFGVDVMELGYQSTLEE